MSVERRTAILAVLGLSAAAYLWGIATGRYGLFPFPALKALQDRVAEATAPAPDLARGREIFRAQCAVCHGAAGQGGHAPDLTRVELSADEIASIIDDGVPGSEMTEVWMPSDARHAVAAYVVSLRRSEAPFAATGDSARGRTLFFGEARCHTCHRVRGEGGRYGPDLTDVGDRRSRGFLRESLVRPDSSIADGYRWTAISTAGGAVHEGFMVGEDHFTIRIFDPEAGFRSFQRRRVEVDVSSASVMPSYETSLTRGELDDLVGYLSSLRAESTGRQP